ncbi:SH3 domain-containing protein [Pseudidiomarina sp. 1APP75-27a]|uniref:SH3 domain-containing protein n=1 Tax=Pseudidiomarina terrestris TaxID=2820060 RepID=UPI002B05D4D1|nr:SH3 domain-containing protein [Pseudidiomarina sp. 1APP75-27a]MEA3588459.1 SH3 domain-containing protein [Pseudidiomarina sp. 1APP75-27a]
MKYIALAISLATLAGCQPAPTEAPETTTAVAYQSLPGYQHDVIGMQEQYLEPEFWVQRLQQPHAAVLTPAQITAFNQRSYAVQDEMVLLDEYPTEFSAAELTDKINSISSLPGYPRFYATGEQATTAQLEGYRSAANLVAVEAVNPVRFGLVVKRSSMRTFPTLDKLYSDDLDLDIDRFQETGVFPGTPLAILHTSTDGKWYLAQSYHYLAWIQASDVAIGPRDEVLAFADKKPFAVVTEAKVETNYTPSFAPVSAVQLDMSTRLPLLSAADTGHDVHGQNPFASYTVQLPIRDAEGALAFSPALIARHHDVHVGYLPYTEANVIRQAFKFLGERYGWGHDYNARDCTGFVLEVYRSMGIDMPRNSSQQGYGEYGDTVVYDENSSNAEKLARLANAKVGDLIYLPGHVVMYIGDIEGQPYVIHDVHGLNYRDAEDQHYQGTLNGVSVTPLIDLGFNANDTYLDRIYAIKSVR